MHILTKIHWVGQKGLFRDLMEKPEQTFWPIQNMHNLKKWELCLTQQTHWGLQVWEAASRVREELLWGVNRALVCVGVLPQRTSWRNKRVLSLNENEVSQVREASAFLCMETWKSLAHRNHSCDVYLGYPGPVSCVFTSWLSPGHLGDWLPSDGC